MNQSFSQIYVHKETQYPIEIFSMSMDIISQWTEEFIRADKIVGAQFYYSNPILYLIGQDIDPETCARLYDNLFLMNVDKINPANFDPTITAVNSVFLEKIGSYAEHQRAVSSNFKDYHNKYGLYLVGINIEAGDVEQSKVSE